MRRIKVTCRRRAVKISKNNVSNDYGVLTRSAAKKRRCRNNNNVDTTTTTTTSTTTMTTTTMDRSQFLDLPVEIQLKIMGYLGCRDLVTLKRTSRKLQSIAMHPSLWKEYEILDDKTDSSEIIGNLKRMSLLRKIVIRNRADTNNIVRQISLSNKHLEELQITYKHSGLPMYLRATLMTRLVQRCERLHTINLDGVYCRSLKVYRLLGKKVFGNLRSLNVKMTMGQIKAFVSHLNEQSRDNVYKSLRELGPRYWKVVRYLRFSDLRWIHKGITH